MAIIIALIIIGLFIYFRKKRKDNTNYHPDIGNFQSQTSNLPFPDRTEAIIWHINKIEKGLKEKDFNLANLSYAKLIESTRQQNINENGALNARLKTVQDEYLKFRNIYNLEYPLQFLPPSERNKQSESNKSHNVVNVSSISDGHNVTELTFELNEEELLRRIVNGTLTKGNDETDIEDITGFYGTIGYSPNQEFCITYCEGHENNGKWKNGDLALVQGKSLLFKKKIPRPNDCHVSNNGIVVCCDWLNFGELIGKFSVFNSKGQTLFSKKTSANLGSCGISDDGKIAAFETYHSKTEDSDSFFIVDVKTNKIINKFDTLTSFNNGESLKFGANFPRKRFN